MAHLMCDQNVEGCPLGNARHAHAKITINGQEVDQALPLANEPPVYSKHDTGKLRFDLLPVQPLMEVAHNFTIGAATYTDRGWEQGMAWGRVFRAMVTHAWKWWGGEKYDRECPNKNCMEGPKRRTQLPPEAGADRYLPCPKCGTSAKRFHHLSAVVWGALVLMEYEEVHPTFDDRALRPRPGATE